MKPWHNGKSLDVILRRGGEVIVIVGAIITATFWLSAEENKADLISKALMEKHLAEIAGVPYAMKSDIDGLRRMMIREKIKDAGNDIQEIDDKIIDETTTPSDLKKRNRLLKDIEQYIAEMENIEDA